jgi:hypothetical protein
MITLVLARSVSSQERPISRCAARPDSDEHRSNPRRGDGRPHRPRIQVSAALAGAGAVWAAPARPLSVWLVQRRSDVTITVTGPDRRKVSVSAKRVADAEQILRSVLERTAQVASPEQGADG